MKYSLIRDAVWYSTSLYGNTQFTTLNLINQENLSQSSGKVLLRLNFAIKHYGHILDRHPNSSLLFNVCELLLASLHYNKVWMWSGVLFGKRGSVVKVKWPKHRRGEYSLYFVKTTPTYSKQYNRTGVQNLSACIRNIVASVSSVGWNKDWREAFLFRMAPLTKNIKTAFHWMWNKILEAWGHLNYGP